MRTRVDCRRLTDGSLVWAVIISDEVADVARIECITMEAAQDLAEMIDRVGFDVERIG